MYIAQSLLTWRLCVCWLSDRQNPLCDTYVMPLLNAFTWMYIVNIPWPSHGVHHGWDACKTNNRVERLKENLCEFHNLWLLPVVAKSCSLVSFLKTTTTQDLRGNRELSACLSQSFEHCCKRMTPSCTLHYFSKCLSSTGIYKKQISKLLGFFLSLFYLQRWKNNNGMACLLPDGSIRSKCATSAFQHPVNGLHVSD